MAFPADWLTPDWPAPDRVRAVCTTRFGGESLPPFDSLNLGDHVGDAAAAVAANRARFARALQARPVFLKQVHGQHTAALNTDTADGIEADGCVSMAPRVACTIMVADCLPVLFTCKQGRAVGAAHAGWRGLAGEGGRDILSSVRVRFRAVSGASDEQMLAWLGPCIGPDAFEVGPEVKAVFEARDPAAGALFKPHGPGKWLADLPGLARQRLRALGITNVYGNDGGSGWCTVTSVSRFFSHRRDRISGRFAASIWLT
jgi:hypothetical protein